MKNLLFGFLSIFFLASCDLASVTVEGNGQLKTEERSVSKFVKLKLEGPIDAVMEHGDSYKVEIIADENVQQYIIVEKEGESLTIGLEDNIRIKNATFKARIVMPEVQSVSLAGSGSLRGDLANPERLKLSVAGSGDMYCKIKTPELEVNIAGSGKAELSGETRDMDVDIAGSGDLLGEKLLSENANISVAGSGNARVFASKTLKISVAGSGNIDYAGNPPEIKKSIAGSGTVRAIQ